MKKHDLAIEIHRKIISDTLETILNIIKEMLDNNATAADFFELTETNDKELTMLEDEYIVLLVFTDLLALGRKDMYEKLLDYAQEQIEKGEEDTKTK